MHSRGLPIVCLVNTTTGPRARIRDPPDAGAEAHRGRRRRAGRARGGPHTRAARPQGHGVRARRGARRADAAEPPRAGARRAHRPPAVARRRRRARGRRARLGVEANARSRPGRTPRRRGRRDRLHARPAGDSRHPRQPGRRRLRDPQASRSAASLARWSSAATSAAWPSRAILAAKGVEVVLVEGPRSSSPTSGCGRDGSRSARSESLANVTIHLGTTVEALGDARRPCGTAASAGTSRHRHRRSHPHAAAGDRGRRRALRPRAALAVHVVGDCAQPRTALEAIHDAAALAHRL